MFKTEVLDALKARRSVRRYLPEQIKEEELAAVLEVGTYAPTAMGQQSPVIVAVQDEADIAIMRRLNQAVMGSDSDTFYGAPTVVVGLADGTKPNWLKDGSLAMGNLMLRVMETPGHTPGSVCLVVGDTIFAGDTLFRANCGRCDFPGGDYRKMLASLARLGRMEGQYTVYPGHEMATDMEFERSYNPYMRQGMAQ